MVSLIEQAKTGLGEYQESHKNKNESQKRACVVETVKSSVISALKCIDGDYDFVRDTRISMLFEVIQDVIKNSNEELYDETQTPGFNPQENCIDNLLGFVNRIKKVVVEQAKF